MAFKNKFNYGNEIFFLSIMTLLLAPHQYKLPGLGIFCFVLITAAVIDWKKNTKLVRRISRRVASCSCEKVRETISHMHVPQMLQSKCTICGAEAK
ncbi:MAG TPA: hypothetical protein PL112_12820 [Candidatus Obscuribacter sp.]|nr:hypothetical protein [Candidatus Obscuribacter sp.]MBK9277306.1 hypothetical protein [Candidatus Obscuribacter sp.]MBL8083964.1 hypothetical protein [Candidatus Obscuribacter sp.]HND07927.1 hypothetical protein [Candidatus Obscuribacter sp.]HND67680.1 hypothetical protein [Candidatus Obscuribacter sp.]